MLFSGLVPVLQVYVKLVMFINVSDSKTAIAMPCSKNRGAKIKALNKFTKPAANRITAATFSLPAPINSQVDQMVAILMFIMVNDKILTTETEGAKDGPKSKSTRKGAVKKVIVVRITPIDAIIGIMRRASRVNASEDSAAILLNLG
jgi:hypothetical protein